MTRTITPTHVLLNQITLAATASSVTFSSIPQNYSDLIVIVSGVGTGNNPLDMEFNGDTTNANYHNVTVYQQGGDATPTSFTTNESYTGTNWYPSSGQKIATFQILDYSASDKHKTYLSRSGGASGWIAMAAIRWANTAPITSIFIDLRGGTFAAGERFSLYGVHA